MKRATHPAKTMQSGRKNRFIQSIDDTDNNVTFCD